MNRIQTAITIFIIINLGLTSAGLAISASSDNLSVNSEDNMDSDFSITRSDTGSSRSVSLNGHGGTWLDRFVNESLMDKSMSDNLRIINNGIGINTSMSVDQNTVALWLFDEGTGTIAYDTTSNDYDGILGGDGAGSDQPVWTTGKYDGALDFDGSDDFVETTYIQNTFNNHDFSITAWINLDISTLDAVIFAIGDADQANRAFEFKIDGSRVEAWHWQNNWYSPYTITVGAWTHLGYVYHASNRTAQLYINGVLTGQWIFGGFLNVQDSSYIPTQIGHGAINRFFNGKIDELCISNVARTGDEIRSTYYNRISTVTSSYTANLTTKPISIPAGMDWDSIYINKSQPASTYINITILDASTNQPIPGAPLYVGDGEFDISYIDPVQYPTIKLNASFVAYKFTTPRLHHLGVSWKASNAWRDAFFDGSLIKDNSYIDFNNGSVECDVPKHSTGYLNSTYIAMPDKSYYNSLIINKSEPAGTQLRVTIYDASTGMPLLDFAGMTGTYIDISSISHVLYPTLQLRAELKAGSGLTPVLFDWSLNWTANNAPELMEFSFSKNYVYRSTDVVLTIDASDLETHESALGVELNYQYNGSALWFNDYFNDLQYTNGKWQVNFRPKITAVLGNYSFKINLTDEFQDYDERLYTDVIEVKNNVPGKPVLVITPAEPTTRDELSVSVAACSDIEAEPISYFYQWYRNHVLQENLTTERVSAEETAKGDVWRCDVTPRDSNAGGFGKMNSTAVLILNSAPEVKTSIESITINEDEIDNSSINLNELFTDDDNDILFFSCTGSENLEVHIDDDSGKVIISPEPDWNGQEDLTFFANDSNAEASTTITVVVHPGNDPPELVTAGTVLVTSKNQYLKFSVYENNWINLSFTAEDIDGDIVSISSNRTDFVGVDDISGMKLEQNTLRFRPDNSHVGAIPVKIILSDSKGGITNYIINLEILNVNNRPSVNIIYPLDNMHFSSDDTIEFKCEYSDPDLLKRENNETLYFTWSSNQYFEDLDTGEYLVDLTDIKLKPGIHEITVEVRDKDGLVNKDSIIIIVEEPDDKGVNSFFESAGFQWIMLIIAVLIVVIIIYIILIVRKKPSEPEPEYTPAVEEPGMEQAEQVQPVFAKPGTIEAPTFMVDQVEGVPQAYPQVQLPVAASLETQVVQAPPVPEGQAPVPVSAHPPPPPPEIVMPQPSEPVTQQYTKPVGALPPAPEPEPAVEPEPEVEPETEVQPEAAPEVSKTVQRQLEKLGELKEKGILTEDEFQRKKEELLGA